MINANRPGIRPDFLLCIRPDFRPGVRPKRRGRGTAPQGPHLQKALLGRGFRSPDLAAGGRRRPGTIQSNTHHVISHVQGLTLAQDAAADRPADGRVARDPPGGRHHWPRDPCAPRPTRRLLSPKTRAGRRRVGDQGQVRALAPQVLQGRGPRRWRPGLPAAKQIAEGPPFELGDGHQAHPGGVAGPGQGHVELAQVLPQAFPVGPLQGLALIAQGQLQLAPVVMPFEGQVLGGRRSEIGGEGEKDQGVFQALGLVDGHHPHQVGVALQADLPGIVAATAPRLLALFGQIADQGLLPVQ